jgi:hypothetical protein
MVYTVIYKEALLVKNGKTSRLTAIRLKGKFSQTFATSFFRWSLLSDTSKIGLNFATLTLQPNLTKRKALKKGTEHLK